MAQANAHPYYLRLLRCLIAQKMSKKDSLRDPLRDDLFEKTKISKSTINQIYADGRANFKDDTLDTLCQSLRIELKEGDNLFLEYDTWVDFIFKERLFVKSQSKSEIIDSFNDKLYSELNEQNKTLIQELIDVRIRFLKAGLDKDSNKPSSGIIQSATPIFFTSAIIKSNCTDSALLERLIYEFGLFTIDWDNLNIESSYETEEKRLSDFIYTKFIEWTSIHSKPIYSNNSIQFKSLPGRFVLQPPLTGCYYKIELVEDALNLGYIKYDDKPPQLYRSLKSIGRIKNIAFKVPDNFYLLKHYEILIDTLHDFLEISYKFLQKKVESSFEGIGTIYIKDIYELLELQTERLNLSDRLSNKFFLTVTKVENNKKAPCGYFINRSFVLRIIKKFMDSEFSAYGAFELLIKFITHKFPDEALIKYYNYLKNGRNFTFEELADLHSGNRETDPILYAEDILHSSNDNDMLYVKTLSEYNNFILELDATGQLRDDFDIVTESVKDRVDSLFKRNVDLADNRW